MGSGKKKIKDPIKHNHRVVTWLIICALIIDQASKILVKTHMLLGNEHAIDILPWFKICFVENNGMAFGMELGGLGGKLFLSLFRIAVISLFIVAINKLIKTKEFSTGFLRCLALVVAGATGNIFDSLFYGIMFNESGIYAGGVSKFVGFGIGEGYAPMLYGKVVDMLYFPLFTFPDWFPIWGGRIFFSPVFNFADVCITCGVLLLLLFYRQSLTRAFSYIDKQHIKDYFAKKKDNSNEE
ncbi:MAG: lipoprotein signal peptidase [Bacteroidaceae bacterium]|nr:lipoprotein signal peptidase [Bacteroidaceae bacterium]